MKQFETKKYIIVRRSLKLISESFVEVQFYNAIPDRKERLVPTSARSAKSSPIPPALPDAPPQPSRHRNKGLETSSAMMELFGGGGGSSFGAASVFDPIPQTKESGSFHRKNVLEKELKQLSDWEAVKYPPVKAPFFTEVEDHNQAYERARKRGNWRTTSSQFDQVAQPGPELFEDSSNTAEQQVDTAASAETGVIRTETPNLGDDWKDAKEDVLGTPTLSEEDKQKMMESEPGPDLGDDEEVNALSGDSESVKKSGDLVVEADDEGGAAAKDAEEEASAEGASGAGGMSLIIRGAQVVNDDSVFYADVLIQDGVIRNVGPSLEVPPDAEILDAAGKMLLPAGIDVHTHLTAPDSADDLVTGCKAAIAGGTATIVVKQWSENVKKEMEKVVSEGVNSFIIDVEGDDILYQVLEHCRTLGVHARVLPENRAIIPYLERKMLDLGITGPEGFYQSRPEELESERVNSLCVLSQLSNCPLSILSGTVGVEERMYIVWEKAVRTGRIDPMRFVAVTSTNAAKMFNMYPKKMSSAESLSALERARSSGALAHAEIASAAVAADGTHYFNNQPLAVCTSGHHAISSESRLCARDFTAMPKGTVGVEERMYIVWEKAVRTGRIDPMRFVAVTSTNAAKMFNMYPKKGRIAVGADADLVLWDASVRWKLSSAERQSSVDASLYDGLTIHAQAAVTIVGGHVAWKDGKIQEAKGSFVQLAASSPYLFSVVQQRDKISTAEKVDRGDSASASNGLLPKRANQEPAHDRPVPRKSHLESNISFGADTRPASTRVRNPPGGRSTGFW
ncbi:amidohydrolase family protein [Ancylostoma ceylanicum]|uniref:Amidohydrolase family protein n=1 Tax=Ancylostoma ceylanicum TaxID=53326 RepID=A0A0D6LMT7_9BILA|nr:amidohydrolase family protein [Ancylostoma ceylanicum]